MSKKLTPAQIGGPAGLALGAAAPLLLLKKKEGETDEQFNARRRGITAASALIGGTAGIHIAPRILQGRFKKTASFFDDYLRKQKIEAARDIQKGDKELEENISREMEEEARARKQELKRREEAGFTNRGFIPRYIGTAAGTALIAKNVPQLGILSGRETLYHGTGKAGIQGIMGATDPNKSGLRLEFSGTKGRLNSFLIPEAIVRAGLEADLGLSESDLLAFQKNVEARIRNNRGQTASQILREGIDDIVARKKLDPSIGNALFDATVAQLPRSGVRVYFANSPDKVVTWADDATEAEKIFKKVQDRIDVGSAVGKVNELGTVKGKLKAQLAAQKRVLTSLATGGAADLPGDYKDQHNYQAKLRQHRSKVTPEFIANLAEQNPNLKFVVGANAPTHDMEMLADFKGISLPLRASPALQSTLSMVPGFEGYDPNRDISTATDVALDNIKHVDAVDPETGKATRYFLDSYKPTKLTAMQRLKALKSGALPLLFTGLGADMVYRGVSGRRGILGSAVDMYKNRNKDQEKTSAKKFRPYLGSAKDALKYGLPLTAVGLGSGILVDKIGRTIVPVEDYEHSPLGAKEEGKAIVRETTRGLTGTALKLGVGAGTGALTGLLAKKLFRRYAMKQLPEIMASKDPTLMPVKALVNTAENAAATVAGFYGPVAAGLLSAQALESYQQAARGNDELRQELGETKEEIMKSPWKSAVLPTIGTLAVAGASMGSLRKNFPGSLRRIKRQAALGPTGDILPKTRTSVLNELANEVSEGGIPDKETLEAAFQIANNETNPARTLYGAKELSNTLGLELSDDATDMLGEQAAAIRKSQREAAERILDDSGLVPIAVSGRYKPFFISQKGMDRIRDVMTEPLESVDSDMSPSLYQAHRDALREMREKKVKDIIRDEIASSSAHSIHDVDDFDKATSGYFALSSPQSPLQYADGFDLKYTSDNDIDKMRERYRRDLARHPVTAGNPDYQRDLLEKFEKEVREIKGGMYESD